MEVVVEEEVVVAAVGARHLHEGDERGAAEEQHRDRVRPIVGQCHRQRRGLHLTGDIRVAGLARLDRLGRRDAEDVDPADEEVEDHAAGAGEEGVRMIAENCAHLRQNCAHHARRSQR